MNDNRMSRMQRTKYQSRVMALPAVGMAEIFVAPSPWEFVGYLIVLMGILYFLYGESRVMTGDTRIQSLSALVLAAALAVVSPVVSSTAAYYLMFRRFRDYRHAYKNSTVTDLLRTERGQMYIVLAILLLIATVYVTIKVFEIYMKARGLN